ncbi:MAG: hypothetical protein M1475_06170 [Actinobacteria bacterium]|nr:hypothetical protein [Actinomycetota bacterium]
MFEIETKNIFFLLKIKCPVIAESFNGRYKLGDIVVDKSNVKNLEDG